LSDILNWLSQSLSQPPNQQSVPLDQTNVLQPVTSWPDVARSYGIGLVRGAIDIGALPGDTKEMLYSMLPTPPHDFPTAAGHYGNLINGLLGARSALELPTSSDLTQGIEKPYWRILSAADVGRTNCRKCRPPHAAISHGPRRYSRRQ
jgi:hypothetical protein